MKNLGLVLLAFSFVLFCIGAWQSGNQPLYNKLIGAGLAFLAAASLFGGLETLVH